MIEALILGIVQGVTEFFPISSTAHLILFPWFFGWSGDIDTLSFDVALHAGTLAALVLCFWRDWVDLIFRKRRILFLIVLASVPAGVTGFMLNDLAEDALRSPFLISIMLITVGVVMLISEKSNRHRNVESARLLDALVIGIAQALAIIPGVSRSGITISAGLFTGLEREAAARFSFLLSTPIIAGATLLHLSEILHNPLNYDIKLFSAGIATSFVTGFLAIKFLLNFLRKHPLNIFVYYRFILSAIIMAGIWLKD
ncbi:MAG: undecaprenyl-diphosphatase UppP [Nitrospirota bacterium]